MAGLTGALNIAKNALLVFQTATQVIGHNIANVSNPYYSKQKVIETTYPPSPSPVGSIGSGVKIETIMRYFDAFLEKNINLRKTDYGLFSAEETGLNLLEALFNETGDTGISQILKNFWNAWQNLANYPENVSARVQVIETAQILLSGLSYRWEGLLNLEREIGTKLKTLTDQINNLTSQIAELNKQIISAEAGGKTANDLRDKRDKLVSELSQILPITYFESKEGAYNIILGKGYNLVSGINSWRLEVGGTEIYWVDSLGNKISLTSREVPSGELSGWIRLLEQISDKYNYEYVAGNKTVLLPSGKPVSEDTQFSELGLSGTLTFTISGKDHFGNDIGPINVSIDSNATLRDLLKEIEKTFFYTVKAYFKDGRLFIEDKFRGSGKLEFSISGDVDFGSFTDPGFQRRISELNLAGKFLTFVEEFVKSVNQIHTQGIGLTFYAKELEGTFSVNKYLKELPYFLNLSKNGTNLSGFFYLWVKDPTNKITPVKIDLSSLSIDATLEDLKDLINETLSQTGFNTVVSATVRNGKLVFQAKEGYTFAFSNDTSGILLATGLNIFFIGDSPLNYALNPVILQNPQSISSGKMDVFAYRTENPLFGIFKSENEVDSSQTFGINKLYLKFYDEKAKNVAIFSQNPSYEKVFFVLDKSVGEDTLLKDLGFSVGTEIDLSGIDHFGNSYSGTFKVSAFSTVEDLIKTIRELFNNTVEIYLKDGMLVIEDKISGEGVLDFSSQALSSNALFGVNYLWKIDENLGYLVEIPIKVNEDTLHTILNKIDRLPYIRAYLDVDEKMVLRVEPNQTKVYGFEIGENFSSGGGSSFVDLLYNQKMYLPAFRWDESNPIERVLSGFERFFLKPDEYDYLSFYLFDEKGKYLGTFRINLDEIINLDGTIFDLIKKINAPENASYGISARLDREGKLIFEITGLYNTKSFIVQDEIKVGENFIQQVYDKGFINLLKGYELKRGDNRIAQELANLASEPIYTLNLSTFEDYYSSLIGEIGIASKSAKDNKSFLADLLNQLKNIKDSFSGVSLDEEMANLIKYQQAFIATSKVLTSVEDMLEALISAKR